MLRPLRFIPLFMRASFAEPLRSRELVTLNNCVSFTIDRIPEKLPFCLPRVSRNLQQWNSKLFLRLSIKTRVIISEVVWYFYCLWDSEAICRHLDEITHTPSNITPRIEHGRDKFWPSYLSMQICFRVVAMQFTWNCPFWLYYWHSLIFTLKFQ